MQTLAQQVFHRVRKQLLDIRRGEELGLAGLQHVPGGRSVHRERGILPDDAAARRKIERVQAERVAGGVEQRQAGVFHSKAALQAGGNRLKQLAGLQVGDQRIIEVEQQAQTIAL